VRNGTLLITFRFSLITLRPLSINPKKAIPIDFGTAFF
jgi:hypothetical protein